MAGSMKTGHKFLVTSSFEGPFRIMVPKRFVEVMEYLNGKNLMQVGEDSFFFFFFWSREDVISP